MAEKGLMQHSCSIKMHTIDLVYASETSMLM